MPIMPVMSHVTATTMKQTSHRMRKKIHIRCVDSKSPDKDLLMIFRRDRVLLIPNRRKTHLLGRDNDQTINLINFSLKLFGLATLFFYSYTT